MCFGFIIIFWNKKIALNNCSKLLFTAHKIVHMDGGERGIRTLETLSTFTRVPVVRLRPAQPSLHDFYIISNTL